MKSHKRPSYLWILPLLFMGCYSPAEPNCRLIQVSQFQLADSALAQRASVVDSLLPQVSVYICR